MNRILFSLLLLTLVNTSMAMKKDDVKNAKPEEKPTIEDAKVKEIKTQVLWHLYINSPCGVGRADYYTDPANENTYERSHRNFWWERP